MSYPFLFQCCQQQFSYCDRVFDALLEPHLNLSVKIAALLFGSYHVYYNTAAILFSTPYQQAKSVDRTGIEWYDSLIAEIPLILTN